MNYWTTPPYKFNLNPATPMRSTLPGLISPLDPYGVANGAYDQNGNLLFYVKGNNVYGSSGFTPVGKLGGYNLSDCYYRRNTVSSEVAIVPIPGSCRQFYVIYGMASISDGYVMLYCKVDCSGSTPVVINWRNVQVSCPPNPLILEPEGFFIAFGSLMHNSFAVSKIYTGTGATAKRYLFSTFWDGINRSIISNTGITGPILIANSKQLGLNMFFDYDGSEAELSWGSNKYAWIGEATEYGENNMVHVIGINSLGAWDNTIQNYSIPGATGIEFNNSTSAYPLLYVSGTNGITKINTQTQTMTSVTLPANINLSHTFLEYGKNNKIYGISPTYDPLSGDLTATTLVGIASNDAITSLDAGFNSFYNTLMENAFTLPDQVDGDDYNQFNGNPIVTLTGFTINNGIPSTNCNSVTNYFNCNPINFTPIYTGGTPTKYKFEIKATDANCNLLTGSGYINYNPGGLTWTTGQPATNLDLRTLTDGAGLNLGNISGKVYIKYTISDGCSYETTKNYTIMVSGAPQPNIVLEILNSSNNQTYQAPSHAITTPVNVGTYTLGYRINNSTGLITYYRAVIDEVASTGSFIKNIYDRTIVISGASGLTYEGLNSYCINSLVWPVNPGFSNCTTGIPDDSPLSVVGYNGYTGYFGYTNGLYSYHRYFKLTVTIGNECSSSTDYSYLYVNERNKSADTGVNTEIPDLDLSSATTVSVYPNPSSDYVTFMINNRNEDRLTIELTDIYGRTIIQLMHNEFLPAGESKRSYNISALLTGVYVYRLKTTTSALNGQFTKN